MWVLFQVENLPFFWRWSLGMMRLIWKSWKRQFAVLKCQASSGVHVSEHLIFILFVARLDTLIWKFICYAFSFTLTRPHWSLKLYCSKTCPCWLWHKETCDHDDHWRWPCLCWQSHWGLPHGGACKWIHPELWHCCLQQNLSSVTLISLIFFTLPKHCLLVAFPWHFSVFVVVFPSSVGGCKL